jgi:hypothetical protein
MLAKHNYTDKQDITSDGKALPTPILGALPKENVSSNDRSAENKETH